MSLISAGSISLDSAFKENETEKNLNKKKNTARTTLKSKGDFPKGEKKIEKKIFAIKEVKAAD
jgi:hypothetical protein